MCRQTTSSFLETDDARNHFLPAGYEQILLQKYLSCSQRQRSVYEYTEKFNKLCSRSSLIESKLQVVSRYIGGLKYEIKNEMLRHTVWNMSEAANLALEIESRFEKHTNFIQTDVNLDKLNSFTESMDKFYSYTQLLKLYPKPLVPSIFPNVIDNTPMEELKENELVVPFEVDRELEEPMNKTSKEVKVSEIDCQTSAFQVEELLCFTSMKLKEETLQSSRMMNSNAHFIGTRPQRRTIDFTWVQALSIMFETHTLVIAAKRVSHWDDNVDALIVRLDGEAVKIPTDGDAEWRTNGDDR
ncbi:hypothetical protein FNV43_RR05462 [Rhamnella rubrinervis]|uniref:Retrotransposon gag domain-containing protein n=1 Tax=Rhamnella rubrinervis TaxID=2594499 RepID=A0A8K0MR45_9ROSA|nr:hypothetical protein FNV43_RR05462 [Rhamnella rubrinervis]